MIYINCILLHIEYIYLLYVYYDIIYILIYIGGYIYQIPCFPSASYIRKKYFASLLDVLLLDKAQHPKIPFQPSIF